MKVMELREALAKMPGEMTVHLVGGEGVRSVRHIFQMNLITVEQFCEVAGYFQEHTPDMEDMLIKRETGFENRNELITAYKAAVETPAAAPEHVDGEPTTFGDCPPGLFRWNDLLCFKSEYSTRPGQPDAYCCDTGEYFWGGSNGHVAARNALMVTPVTKRESGK